ncbi:MAG: HlyU family transcriptional regulator [Pseudomonadota bacterium]
MSLLSKLFGGSKSAEPDEKIETYKDFKITPTPIREGSKFRLSARIDKDLNGEARSHTLIRADLFGGQDEAAEASVLKARQMIDEQGERLFS